LKGRIVILERAGNPYFTTELQQLFCVVKFNADVILKEHASTAFMIQILKKNADATKFDLFLFDDVIKGIKRNGFYGIYIKSEASTYVNFRYEQTRRVIY
jgi:uridylate kinase